MMSIIKYIRDGYAKMIMREDCVKYWPTIEYNINGIKLAAKKGLARNC